MDAELQQAIRELVDALVVGRYDELERDGRGGRLSAQDLRRAISEYPAILVPLPDAVWPLVDEYHPGPNLLTLDVPLWTAEEGRSDLTLQLRAHKSDTGYRLEIDDLHVL